MRKLVLGVGLYEKGKYVSWENGRMTQGYRRWSCMLKRCYSAEYQKEGKSYIGCSVSDEFKVFQKFMLWSEKQIGYDIQNNQLDKDILFEGNKTYSADTCCFVPLDINIAMIKPCSVESGLPLGVAYDKSRDLYKAVVGMNSKGVQIGRYSTVQDAFLAYKYYKEAYIKHLALKHQHILDLKVFDALINYEIKQFNSCI